MLKELSILFAFSLLLVTAHPGIGDLIGDAIDSSVQGVKDAGHVVKEGVETGVHGVQTGVDDVGDSISSALNQCGEATFTASTDCAILYDHHRCIGWAEPVSSAGYREIDFRRKNDAESVVVKKGCVFIGYQHASADPSQRGRSVTVEGTGKTANVVMELHGSTQLQSEISAVSCTC